MSDGEKDQGQDAEELFLAKYLSEDPKKKAAKEPPIDELDTFASPGDGKPPAPATPAAPEVPAPPPADSTASPDYPTRAGAHQTPGGGGDGDGGTRSCLLIGLGAMILVALVVGILVVLISGGGNGTPTPPGPAAPNTAPNRAPTTAHPTTPAGPDYDGPEIQVGIAYGTEKKNWLKWARGEFRKTPAGKRIAIRLLPMGSREGAQAVLEKDQRIHVWSPASPLYRDEFTEAYKAAAGRDPIEDDESLVRSPMVFVFWEERYKPFLEKYKTVSFDTIRQALNAKDGWTSIASQAPWGLFKFGHTNPTKSNSGGVSLTLMAYHHFDKDRDLTLAEIQRPAFKTWLAGIEEPAFTRTDSTGSLMRDMIAQGPGGFDCVMVYESLAIEYAERAEKQWPGNKLVILYPKRNMMNSHPYYILDVPWSREDHREAARVFLRFLLQPAIQREALKTGFRPGNLDVSIQGKDSPFTSMAQYGIQLRIPNQTEAPKAKVLAALLEMYKPMAAARQRRQGGRDGTATPADREAQAANAEAPPVTAPTR